MTRFTATDAKNRFGQVLDLARTGPVTIEKNGRDVAVVLSAEEFARLMAETQKPRVNPRLEALLADSIERRRPVYEALAK